MRELPGILPSLFADNVRSSPEIYTYRACKALHQYSIHL